MRIEPTHEKKKNEKKMQCYNGVHIVLLQLFLFWLNNAIQRLLVAANQRTFWNSSKTFTSPDIQFCKGYIEGKYIHMIIFMF